MNCRFIHESLLGCLLPNRLKNKRLKNKCVHSQQHFLIQVIEKNPPFETGRASMCQSGWVSSVNVIKIRQNNSMKDVVVGVFFLFALHLPSNSAKMSREKFMSVIIWQQKPLFCFHVKLVKFQSLLSKSVCEFMIIHSRDAAASRSPGGTERQTSAGGLRLSGVYINKTKQKKSKIPNFTLLKKPLFFYELHNTKHI